MEFDHVTNQIFISINILKLYLIFDPFTIYKIKRERDKRAYFNQIDLLINSIFIICPYTFAMDAYFVHFSMNQIFKNYLFLSVRAWRQNLLNVPSIVKILISNSRYNQIDLRTYTLYSNTLPKLSEHLYLNLNKALINLYSFRLLQKTQGPKNFNQITGNKFFLVMFKRRRKLCGLGYDKLINCGLSSRITI